MNKKQLIGAVVAAVLFIVIGVSSVWVHAFSETYIMEAANEVVEGSAESSPPSQDYIGVVAVTGTIQEQTETDAIFARPIGYQHDSTLDFIDAMMEESNNKGILLEIDSPGGTVYEAEELYLKLQEYREHTSRPVWTYMKHYAASGGYYIAAPSDKIYANPNTTTGSIGVIISGYDMSELYQKLGIKSISITSGPNKDMSAPNAEQTQIYQSLVDESFGRFVQIVADGRHMSQEQVRGLADGRIYTALQAKENGLIDEISLYDEMKEEMSASVGTSDFYQPTESYGFWSSLFAKLEEMKPKSEAEILTNLTKEYGSGVPMYYAEQLR